MSSEIGSAIEEAVSRKSDAALHAEIDSVFKAFSEQVAEIYHRYDATVPDGMDLRELRQQVFGATRDGARLRAAEKVIRAL